jgi:hypothetical protein
MAGEGSSSGAKRPAYHDLDSSDWDDIVATPMEIPTASDTQSAPSSTSEGKKKQKASAHEKNPQYPPKQYGHFIREKVLEWYNKKVAGMLERTYIQHNADGLMSVQVELNGVQGGHGDRRTDTSVRPSVMSDKVLVRQIRVNAMLTSAKVKPELLCPPCEPH